MGGRLWWDLGRHLPQVQEGTYNALLLAAALDCQGQGAGSRIMRHLEDYLQKKKQAPLVGGNSGTDEYAKTRDFYQKKLSHDREARIRDFYAAGDDKIIFRKKLD